MAKQQPTTKKRKYPTVPVGCVYIHASFNNTLVTLTDPNGNVLSFSSAGKHFKGSRKSMPFSAQVAAEDLLVELEKFNMKELTIYINGPGRGRESGAKPFVNAPGIKVVKIIDTTTYAFNGCRPRKQRKG